MKPNDKYARAPGTYEARKRFALEFFRKYPYATTTAIRKALRSKFGKAMDTYKIGELRNEARAEQRLPPIGPNHKIKTVRNRTASARLPPQLELVDDDPPKGAPPTLAPTLERMASDALATKLATIRDLALSIDNLARLEVVVDDNGGAAVRYTIREVRTHEWGNE